MNEPKHGGPAFPHSHLGISRGALSYEDSDYDDGMTLRDYFAAKAMQALISIQPSAPANLITTHSLAFAAYAMADIMLQERKN